MSWAGRVARGFLVAVGCVGCTPATPDLAACRAMAAGAEKDACFAAFTEATAPTDPTAAEAAAAEIGDAALRDFTYFAVSRADPTTTRWCEKIADPTLAQRCHVLVNRPHLHPDKRGEKPAEKPR